MAVIVSKQLKVPSVEKQASDYAVGDTVKIPVNGANTDFLVVHQGNPSTSLYDSSCNGTWLLMKDCYESRQWHSSDVNDYANSTIKSYIDSTFYNLLSASAKAAVKQVKIPYRPGSGTSTTCNTGANGLSCKIFLLASVEVGFNDPGTLTDEGVKLQYFESGDSTSANNKRIANLSGTACEWWLRSPYVVYGTAITAVASNGVPVIASYKGNYGVRPALIINSDTKFDPDTNVIIG